MKTTLIGFVLITACVLCSRGWLAALDFIKSFVTAVGETTGFLVSLALQFPNQLGIANQLWTKGIYITIAIAATGLVGYAFTRKEKKCLLGIIGSVVSLISTILTFSKSK